MLAACCLARFVTEDFVGPNKSLKDQMTLIINNILSIMLFNGFFFSELKPRRPAIARFNKSL